MCRARLGGTAMSGLINPSAYGASWIDREEADAVRRALLTGDLFRHNGGRSACDLAENQIAEEMGARGAVVLANGTAAIRAMLHATGVRAGDTVLVNAFTFHATASAVYALGARPIPVDLDLGCNIDVDHIRRMLPLRPVAVVAVHWPGRCFHLGRLREICTESGLVLLEDSAQAFGSRNGDAVAGRQGMAGAYSFQQGKLVTCGEGGCVVSDDAGVLERVRAYSDHGMRRTADGSPVPEPVWSAGDNLRMTGLQAAMLTAQLAKLKRLRERLIETKHYVRDLLAARGVVEWNPIPEGDIGQILTLRFRDRDSTEKAACALAHEGVLLKPIWRRPYPELFPPEQLAERTPMATAIADTVRAIPLPPTLTLSQCRIIADAVSRLTEWLSA